MTWRDRQRILDSVNRTNDAAPFDEPQPEPRERAWRNVRCEACGQLHDGRGQFCRLCDDQIEQWGRDREEMAGVVWPRAED